MELPKLYTTINQSQRRDFQETLAKFSSWLTWGEDECDVLDVGCGSGDVTRDVLRPSLQCNNPRIVGVDVSQAMVDFARTSCTDELQFHVMDIATSQNPRHTFPNGFDKIYSNCTLHWVSDERRAFQNMYDLLKPGGEMVHLFMAWHPGIHGVEILATKPKWSPFCLQNALQRVFPHQHSEHPEKEVRELLESLGFHVESCECYERKFPFENRKALYDYLFALNAFQPYIGKENCAEFIEEVLQNMARTEQQPNGTYVMTYTLVEVFARKPLKQ